MKNNHYLLDLNLYVWSFALFILFHLKHQNRLIILSLHFKWCYIITERGFSWLKLTKIFATCKYFMILISKRVSNNKILTFNVNLRRFQCILKDKANISSISNDFLILMNQINRKDITNHLNADFHLRNEVHVVINHKKIKTIIMQNIVSKDFF